MVYGLRERHGLLGLDSAGNPFIWTYDYQGDLKIWLVSAPRATDALDSSTYTGNVPVYAGNNNEFGPLVSDSNGAWFGSTTGLFLYNPNGLHKVSKASGIPVGQCI